MQLVDPYDLDDVNYYYTNLKFFDDKLLISIYNFTHLDVFIKNIYITKKLIKWYDHC